MDISRVRKVTLRPHLMYPVAAIHGKRYCSCKVEICIYCAFFKVLHCIALRHVMQ